MELNEIFQDEIIFEPKEEIRSNKRILYLKEGLVKVEKNGYLIKLCKTGDFINIQDYLESDGSYEYFALQKCKVNRVSKDYLRNVFRTCPELFHTVATLYAREIKELHERVEMLSKNSVRERMIKTFSNLTSRYGNELKLSLKTSEWARYVGTSTETYIRMLGQFQREGIIDRGNRSVKYPIRINKDKVRMLMY